MTTIPLKRLVKMQKACLGLLHCMIDHPDDEMSMERANHVYNILRRLDKTEKALDRQIKLKKSHDKRTN